jgi:hypothetical protein
MRRWAISSSDSRLKRAPGAAGLTGAPGIVDDEPDGAGVVGDLGVPERDAAA